jgi:hypothetical protein
MARFDANKFNRELRAAQRRAEAEHKRQVDAYNRKVEQHNKKVISDYNREVDRVNRENQRRVDEHNRKADQHNKRVIADYNRDANRVNAYNKAAIDDLNRRLRSASSGPRFTVTEQALADRVQLATPSRDEREWDAFLSYAVIDGADVADELRRHLEALGTSVWFAPLVIKPGQSQALQMDKGLQKARAGVALLTPAYLVGRFWTERELGALLHKETLIPVLHGVSFAQVAEYSGILPDLAGFETARDSVEVIAQKIAAALSPRDTVAEG